MLIRQAILLEELTLGRYQLVDRQPESGVVSLSKLKQVG
jgi:hypothetical protein